MQGKHRCLPLEIRFYRTTNLDGVLLLLAIYFAVGALAADCTGGAANNCAQGKCEMADTAEICTECTINGGKAMFQSMGFARLTMTLPLLSPLELDV